MPATKKIDDHFFGVRNQDLMVSRINRNNQDDKPNPDADAWEFADEVCRNVFSQDESDSAPGSEFLKELGTILLYGDRTLIRSINHEQERSAAVYAAVHLMRICQDPSIVDQAEQARHSYTDAARRIIDPLYRKQSGDTGRAEALNQFLQDCLEPLYNPVLPSISTMHLNAVQDYKHAIKQLTEHEHGPFPELTLHELIQEGLNQEGHPSEETLLEDLMRAIATVCSAYTATSVMRHSLLLRICEANQS